MHTRAESDRDAPLEALQLTRVLRCSRVETSQSGSVRVCHSGHFVPPAAWQRRSQRITISNFRTARWETNASGDVNAVSSCCGAGLHTFQERDCTHRYLLCPTRSLIPNLAYQICQSHGDPFSCGFHQQDGFCPTPTKAALPISIKKLDPIPLTDSPLPRASLTHQAQQETLQQQDETRDAH